MDLAHVALCVSDLDRAMSFYEALGFEETNRFTLDGVENVYLGRDGDGDLQLRHDPDRADVDHVAFTVEDVTAIYETALDAGAAPVLEPTEVPEAAAFAAFVEDPEGYTVELYRWL